MAVSKNKSRITISLENKLIQYIKNRAKSNGKTVSEEIAAVFYELQEKDK